MEKIKDSRFSMVCCWFFVMWYSLPWCQNIAYECTKKKTKNLTTQFDAVNSMLCTNNISYLTVMNFWMLSKGNPMSPCAEITLKHIILHLGCASVGLCWCALDVSHEDFNGFVQYKVMCWRTTLTLVWNVWLGAGRHDIGLLYRASWTQTVLFQTDDWLINYKKCVVLQIAGLIPQLPTPAEWYTLFLTMNLFLLFLGLITEILHFIYLFINK